MAADFQHRRSTLRFYQSRMRATLDYIRERLGAPLELDDLAQRAGLSAYHFHRVFRGMVGEPLMTHVRRLRLERAAVQLRRSPRRVLDIALDAGYDSHEAFTRAFRHTFGTSPSAFRRGDGGRTKPPRRFRSRSRTLPMLSATIETLPPARVAYLRHIGPYSNCGPTWDRLCAWMGKEGYLGPDCRMIGISYDDPESTPARRLRYDACVTIDDSFRPGGRVRVQVIAGGEYARVTHFGPYDRLGDTYAKALGQWIPRSGRRLRDAPCFEIYLNHPACTAPADLVTDIYLPLVSP